jgi:hypothetical protein
MFVYVNDKKNLEKEIIRIIIFFDMFDFPLASFEIWKYLRIKCEFGEILKTLDLNIANIETKNGFYFLTGRQDIIEKRMKRYNYANRKYKRAILISRFFKFIPWIKMIAIGNIIGAHNMKDDGDIDFFVITEKGKIWLTRFLAVGFLKVLNLRPTPKNKRDKICLSFYVDEKNLNLKNLMIKDKDIYFIHWFSGLTPIYDENDYYYSLVKANTWINEILPNWQMILSSQRLTVGKNLPATYKKIINFMFGGLETLTKKFQLKIMPLILKEEMNKETAVVINDGVLKLYIDDRRQEIADKYKQLITNNTYERN